MTIPAPPTQIPPPTPPQSTDPLNFDARADAFVGWMAEFGPYTGNLANWFKDRADAIESQTYTATTAATEAGESADTASDAATSANASKVAAADAEAQAEAARDAASLSAANAAAAAQTLFNGIYLGASATDPSTDLNGQALGSGDFYYNTTAKLLRVYDAAIPGFTTATPSGQFKRVTFTAGAGFTPGTTTSLTLPTDPVTKSNLFVFFGGSAQPADTYSLAGLVLTFTAAIPSGVQVVEVAYLEAIGLAVPGDGTVTNDKIAANAAIASSKLALTGELAGTGAGKGSRLRGDAEVPLADYAALRAFAGAQTRVYVTGVMGTVKPAGIAGVFQVDASDTTSADNGGTVILGADGRRWKRDYSGAVNVLWFGAKADWNGSTGTDNLAAFNAAAAVGTNVTVPGPGAYFVSAATVAAMWIIEDGATIAGLPDVNGTTNDTSRLTGRVVHYEFDSDRTGIRVGSSNPWLERSRSATIRIAEFVVQSATGQIGIIGATRTSDNLAPNFAAIGVCGYGINDNATNPEPAWASYMEARRSAGAGAAYGVEYDMINNGDVFDLDPYTPISTTTGQTVNVWLTNGGGDASWNGDESSAALALHANPKPFRRGIVIRAGALDPTLSEAMTMNFGARVAWYNAQGSLASYIWGRQIFMTSKSDTANQGIVFDSIRTRSTTLQTQSLDTVHRHTFTAHNGTSGYVAGFHQVLQRGNFSDGNARFSYDMQVTNNDGTTTGVTINGLADKSFAPNPDNAISLGTGAFRWSTVFAGTGTISTSDARAKIDIEDLDEAETLVAKRLKKLVKKYRFRDAVAEKGDRARIHVGVIAQDVQAAFEAEGLDPFAYSVLCWDKWEAQEAVTRSWPAEYDDAGNLVRATGSEVIEPAREAGDRYGIRYDELFAFIIGAL